MYRSPSEFRRTPPSPRTPSVTSRPRTPGGQTIPVGWNGPISGPLPGVRGHLVVAAPAAGRHHDRLRLEVYKASRLAGIGQSPHDAPLVILEEPRDRGLHVDLGLGRQRPLLEGSNHLQARPVANVTEPAVRVAAEGALGYLALLRPVEERTPLLELVDPIRGLLGEDLRHPPVVEELAAPHGVHEVRLPTIVGIHVPHRRSYATLGHNRVGLAEQALSNHTNREAALCRGDRRPQASTTGADDQYVVLPDLVTVTGTVCLHFYLPILCL